MNGSEEIIIVELTAAIDDVGTLKTFYLSDTSYATQANDVPANTALEPALLDPGSIGIHVFSDGKTGGKSSLETGEIVISNSNGQFDAWLNYSFEGRPVTIRFGKTFTAYPATFTNVFVGTVQTLEPSVKQIVITFKDKQALFLAPLALHYYAGNNALPNGLEGLATDLKGKPKPRLFGKANNISPVLVNTSKLIYQVNDGAVQSISAVYDSALALTNAGDYATSALLQVATLSTSSQYATCLTEGYFRLSSNPVGQITADVIQGTNAGSRTVAQIAKQMALTAISNAEISSSDIVNLDGINNAVAQYYTDDTTTIQDALDALVNSIGAYYFFDPSGILRLGVLTLANNVDLSLFDYDIQNDFERKTSTTPMYSFTINHTKNWTIQNSSIASSVTADRRGVIAQEFASEVVSDPTIRNKYLGATASSTDTMLTSAADALSEGNRQLGIYRTVRSFYEFSINLKSLPVVFPNLMLGIALTYARYGLNTGKIFRLIGVNLVLKNKQAVFTVWG